MKKLSFFLCLALTSCVAQRLESTSQIVKVVRIDKNENCEGIDYFNSVYIYFTPRDEKCNVGRFYILREIDGEVYTREIKESEIEYYRQNGHGKHEKLFDKKIK